MQTTYKMYADQYLKGQVTDVSIHQIDGFTAEGVIQFGTPVQFGTLYGEQVKTLADIAAGLCIGFAVRERKALTGQYEIASQVQILRLGRIAVEVKEDVNAGDVAYVYADATIGKTEENGLVVGKFNTAGKANGLAELQVQLLY